MQAIANDSNRGGEVSITANPAISELLATCLADEKARLAAKIHGLYADVIERLQHNLNGYAANSPDKDEYELWEELFDADGGRHREFCYTNGTNY